MHRINLFVEDFGHTAFLTALLQRYGREYRLPVGIVDRSVRHGHGRVISELKEYVRDLRQNRERLPDALVVAIDANCSTFSARRQEIERAAAEYKELAIYAVPEPHIERWLLIDSEAFKAVLGRGCSAPDQKCDKARYKDLLARAVKAAGIEPILGGMEHAEEIVNAMDLQRMEQVDHSFGELLKDLRQAFKKWSQSDLPQTPHRS